MKNQKGITLVALIFTIIVMLILVGASIMFATEGRLFERAQEAAEKTQLEVDRETLLSEVVGAYNEITGYINYDKLDENISEIEFTGENGTYTSKSGNVFYVNQITGTITAEADE